MLAEERPFGRDNGEESHSAELDGGLDGLRKGTFYADGIVLRSARAFERDAEPQPVAVPRPQLGQRVEVIANVAPRVGQDLHWRNLERASQARQEFFIALRPPAQNLFVDENFAPGEIDLP